MNILLISQMYLTHNIGGVAWGVACYLTCSVSRFLQLLTALASADGVTGSLKEKWFIGAVPGVGKKLSALIQVSQERSKVRGKNLLDNAH